jgi:murein DD-endopeptidase MepM/ murein hydrolase activator NlpD
MMRRFFLSLMSAVLLSSCTLAAPEPTPTALPTVTAQLPTSTPAPSATATPVPSATASVTPAPTATAIQDCGAEPICTINGHFLFQRPINSFGKQSIEHSYLYGTTQGGIREPHHGVEFYNAQGTPIYAAADGKVVFAGSDQLTLLAWITGYYGNVVVIEHHFPGFPQTFYTLYGHQYKVDVKVGQEIKAGQQIGQVGATGTARGSHLHFELRLANNDYKSSRNPELWLLPLPGTGVLAGRIEDAQGGPLKGQVNIQRIENGAATSNSFASAETYYVQEAQPINADDIFHENFVVGELPSGDYRLTMLYNGVWYDQMVKIEEGKLTLVKLVVK